MGKNSGSYTVSFGWELGSVTRDFQMKTRVLFFKKDQVIKLIMGRFRIVRRIDTDSDTDPTPRRKTFGA
jgi:hypothetical protein